MLFKRVDRQKKKTLEIINKIKHSHSKTQFNIIRQYALYLTVKISQILSFFFLQKGDTPYLIQRIDLLWFHYIYRTVNYRINLCIWTYMQLTYTCISSKCLFLKHSFSICCLLNVRFKLQWVKKMKWINFRTSHDVRVSLQFLYFINWVYLYSMADLSIDSFY